MKRLTGKVAWVTGAGSEILQSEDQRYPSAAGKADCIQEWPTLAAT